MIAATILLGRALAPVEQAMAGWKALVDARSAYGRLDSAARGRAARTRPSPSLPAPQGALAVERVVFGFRGQRAPGDQAGVVSARGGRGARHHRPQRVGQVHARAPDRRHVEAHLGRGAPRWRRCRRRGRASAWAATSATCRRTSSSSPAPSARTSRAWAKPTPPLWSPPRSAPTRTR